MKNTTLSEQEKITHRLSRWLQGRQPMYFILIKDIFFCHKSKQIQITYASLHPRLNGTMSLQQFMHSPLQHATHPEQLLRMGMETARHLHEVDLAKIAKQRHSERRFKRVFYPPDNIM